MPISKKDVEHIGLLSRINLSEEEKERFTEQLMRILEYIEKLEELDTSDVEPVTHAVALRNVLREDAVKPSLPSDEGLAAAPDKKASFFKVPRVIE
jgi:aspartyl-tRNA(Asn)/glutamyl-tRNA(Gln) amidotransferase subunit C